MTNEERRSQSTRSSSTSNALCAPVGKGQLTADQKALITQIAFIWAEHQGWPKGKWPRERRYDAVLITEWVRRLGGPVTFWKAAISRVPKGAAFTALITSPAPGRTCLLEDVLSKSRESQYSEQKKQFAEDSNVIGAVIRRLGAAGA